MTDSSASQTESPQTESLQTESPQAETPQTETPPTESAQTGNPEDDRVHAVGPQTVAVQETEEAAGTAPDDAPPSGLFSEASDSSDATESGHPADGPDSEPVEADPVADSSDGMDSLEIEGDIAADYLEELLDIADLDGDLDMDVEGDRAAVSIVGGDVRQLVGRDGEVLEALQELTRLAVNRETGERSRLMLDVGGFRADKRSRLEKVAASAVEEVKSSGEKKALDAMSAFERKVVHDVVAAAGLSSASEGEEPRRYVVVLPE